MGKFQYTRHKKMWKYILENICKEMQLNESNVYSEDTIVNIKWAFLKKEDEPALVHACYACDYCNGDCSECPLDIDCCMLDDSLYSRLLNAISNGNIVNVLDFVSLIKDAKVKEGVEWE